MRTLRAIGAGVIAVVVGSCQRAGGPDAFSSDSRAPVSVPVVEGCRFHALPRPNAAASEPWEELLTTATAPSLLSLTKAEQWYDATVAEAQRIFHAGAPPSVQWLEQNARDRRAFLDAWADREAPALVVDGGAFRIAAPVAEAFVSSALAQGERDRARLWMARADRSRVSEVCLQSLAD